MVRVSYFKAATCGKVIINGHAGWAEKGSDIVCAAVSALANLIIANMPIENDEKNGKSELVKGEGYIKISSTDKDMLSCFDMVLKGFLALESMYPDNVIVEVVNTGDS